MIGSNVCTSTTMSASSSITASLITRSSSGSYISSIIMSAPIAVIAISSPTSIVMHASYSFGKSLWRA